MIILSLNLWGGRRGGKLFDYLKEQSANVDIFCFQEVFDYSSAAPGHEGVYTNLLSLLKESLPGFDCFYAPAYEGWIDKEKVDFKISEGQAIFVKKGIEILDSGFEYIFGNATTVIEENFENEPKILQYVKIKSAGKDLLVVNVHGSWFPGDKQDTPQRIQQSENILNFSNKFKLPQIIIGDFNLYPETKSVQIFELAGFNNLIKDYKIESTRNKISWEHYHNVQHFADFVFVTENIEVKGFNVPYNEVSDHLPLLLEFSLK